MFWGPGIYFVIVNGGILTISDDASCPPKGGWFPAIVTGPTEAERECLQKLMETLEFDETFFTELVEECGEFDVDYVEDFFNNNDDEESLKIYRKIEQKVNAGKRRLHRWSSWCRRLPELSWMTTSTMNGRENTSISSITSVIRAKPLVAMIALVQLIGWNFSKTSILIL